ncbi:hypothetical protein CAAN3_07S03180 [[Candida] anglica]
MAEELEITLKPTSETFIDDPTSLDEVNVDEIVFDISHSIKDINKLHVYHSICIFKNMLQDIIKLQSNSEMFHRFRKQQLEKYYQININDLSSNSNKLESSSKVTRLSTPPLKSDTPPCSPPLKFARVHKENFNDSIKETTPDSLDDRNEVKSFENGAESEDDDGSQDGDAPYIMMETLREDYDANDIGAEKFYELDNIRQEIAYNESRKIKDQNSHILKGFGLAKKPTLSIEEFLVRLQTYSSSLSVSVYIQAAYMMFKLCILLDIVPLTDLNVYRFILASVRCSTKTLEDIYQKQKVFATVGGVSQKDLFKIEVGFLYLCNFKVVFSENNLQRLLKDNFVDLRQFMKDDFNDN